MAITLSAYFERDPSKKNKDWANQVVGYLRMNMRHVVDPNRAREGMQWLLGEYPMRFAQEMFKDPGRSGVQFVPLAVLEKVRNVLASEIEDAGIHIELKCIDPTAITQKDADRELLANRKPIEAVITSLRSQINLPPYSLKDEQGVFNGNVEEFDSMGLADNNDEDLEYFFRTHYRLRHEIELENPVNYFIKFNEVKENFTLWVNDILAKKAIFHHSYVSEQSGAVIHKYVAPETVRVIMGKRRDFKDASAISYDQLVSVSQFLDMVGDDFNFETELEFLLRAVNYNNNTEYTGVYADGYYNSPYYREYSTPRDPNQPNSQSSDNIMGGDRITQGRDYFGWGTANMCTYDQFMNFKVSIGYIEWKSINSTTYGVKNKPNENARVEKRAYNWKPAVNSSYNKKTEKHECTYRAFYLSYGPSDQRLFKYGKLPYQTIEGAEDTLSNFSIAGYKEIGRTVVDIASPFIVIVEKAFKKFEHMIMKALPPGFDYDMDSLVDIARKVVKGVSDKGAIDEVVRWMEGSPNKFHIKPKQNGQPISNGQVNYPIPNGLAPAVIEFKNVVDWGYAKIMEELGISPLRAAYTPAERDGYKLQMQANAYSDKATGYMPRMIHKMLEHTASTTLLFVQSIVKYRTVNPKPYKFLLTALGDRTVEDIKSLHDVAAHRYGVFVESFNSYQEYQEMKAIVLQAFTNKEITAEQYLLISTIRSPKKAAMVLAYEKRRQERKQQENIMQQQQAQAAMQQQMQQAEMQKVQMEGQLRMQNTQLEIDGRLREKQMEVQGELDKQSMKASSDQQKIDTKKRADMEENVLDANLRAQEPIGTV